MYDHVTSTTVHEDTVKKVLTDVRYYLLIYVSKYAILHCNPVLLSSRKVLVLVLVLKDQFTSPCPCHRAVGHWIQHWSDFSHTSTVDSCGSGSFNRCLLE